MPDTIRVLIIDPSHESRALMRRIVSVAMADAVVDAHDLDSNGLPGESFPWTDYDAVLFEHALGDGRNGLEWLHGLTANPDVPPVVVVTGTGDEYVAVAAMKAGASDYLNKRDLTQQRLTAVLRGAVASLADPTGAEEEGSITRTRTGSRSGGGTWPSGAGGKPAHELGADFPSRGIPGYRVHELLGTGATAKVYLAEKDGIDGMLVLKILEPVLVEDNQFLERFLQEAEIVLKMRSPHIVKIYEQAFTDAGCFIAMEHLAGGDLRSRIAAGLGPEDALHYFVQILRGLDAIHEVGIVHRDLKPANIMFRADGTLAIVDFGISKQSEALNSLTDAGSVLGSPHYLSPEQGRGQPTDRRSDFYSAGIIFYEMLTGEKPYQGNTPSALIYEHLYGDIPTLPDPLGPYQSILEKLLAKDPSDRELDIGNLVSALTTIGPIGAEDGAGAGVRVGSAS